MCSKSTEVQPNKQMGKLILRYAPRRKIHDKHLAFRKQKETPSRFSNNNVCYLCVARQKYHRELKILNTSGDDSISWLPVVPHRCLVRHSTVAVLCPGRSAGGAKLAASRTISQQRSWTASSWRSYRWRPDSVRWANQCTRCPCSRTGHCEGLIVTDAWPSRGSKCTRIHRIHRSLLLVCAVYWEGLVE